MHIHAALSQFLVQLEADGRSPHTINQYDRHIRTFARWAAGVGLCGDLSQIGHHDVARFLVAPEARTRPDGGEKSAGSMNCLRTSIRGFFQYLVHTGEIPQDPSCVVRRARCGRRPPKTMSPTERAKFLATLKKAETVDGRRDYALFHLMLARGSA